MLEKFLISNVADFVNILQKTVYLMTINKEFIHLNRTMKKAVTNKELLNVIKNILKYLRNNVLVSSMILVPVEVLKTASMKLIA
jgi:hypothetical protein